MCPLDTGTSLTKKSERTGRHGREINTGKNMAEKRGTERSGSMRRGMVGDMMKGMVKAGEDAAIRI